MGLHPEYSGCILCMVVTNLTGIVTSGESAYSEYIPCMVDSNLTDIIVTKESENSRSIHA